LAAAGVSIVCVSDFHEAQIRRNFAAMPEEQRPNVTRIYNPVDVSDRNPEPQSVDPNKLVFFSSPHKGLDYALHIFARMYDADRHLRLYVANPGYSERTERARPGVVNLGSVPHHVIMGHVQTALFAFCPNYVYPETFGLVLAESNALGTPVIAHPIGAAPEVILGEDQFMAIPKIRSLFEPAFFRWPVLSGFVDPVLAKFGCFDAYAERIRAWQHGRRPIVTGRPEFSLGIVCDAWRKLLEAD
jgi:glycosyltransferase involved in cell wall biosynthesis